MCIRDSSTYPSCALVDGSVKEKPMKTKMTRNLAGILVAVGVICTLSVVLLAQEYNFAGTWRAEIKPPAAPAGGAPGGAPGGGRGGPGGGGFGGAGGGGGVQKITLRVKVNKEKASGNFTVGSSATEDIREGHIEGNKLIFKTGTPPAQIYDNEAVLIGEELSLIHISEPTRLLSISYAVFC